MQCILHCILLTVIHPHRILAWVEPQGYDICPADVFERSTQSSSLLQGVTHKSRHSQKSKATGVGQVGHTSRKSTDHGMVSHDDDDDLPVGVKPHSRTSKLAEQQLKQKAQLPKETLVNVSDRTNGSIPVMPSMSEAQLPQQLLLNVSDGVKNSILPKPVNATNVEQLVLLLTAFKSQVHGALRGAPLQAVAGMMTVVLGIALLTALTLVLRPAPLHFDEAEAVRPAPVDKLLLHSHCSTAAAKSGLIQKNSDAFCPELIVPDGSECVLMVPTLPPTAPDDHDPGDPIFHIVDQEGSTCLCIRLQSCAVPGEGLRRATSGLRERIVLMSATRLRVLAYCERHGLSFHVHCHDDELFARLSRDETGAYAMVGRSGPLLMYNGQMTDCSVRVTNVEGQLLAYCEKGNASHITLRVGPLVDVGLIVCGLLALDRMEMERLSMRALTMQTAITDSQVSVAGS